MFLLHDLPVFTFNCHSILSILWCILHCMALWNKFQNFHFHKQMANKEYSKRTYQGFQNDYQLYPQLKNVFKLSKLVKFVILLDFKGCWSFSIYMFEVASHVHIKLSNLIDEDQQTDIFDQLAVFITVLSSEPSEEKWVQVKTLRGLRKLLCKRKHTDQQSWMRKI